MKLARDAATFFLQSMKQLRAQHPPLIVRVPYLRDVLMGDDDPAGAADFEAGRSHLKPAHAIFRVARIKIPGLTGSPGQQLFQTPRNDECIANGHSGASRHTKIVFPDAAVSAAKSTRIGKRFPCMVYRRDDSTFIE